MRSEHRRLARRTPTTSHKRRLGRYSPAAMPSGIFKKQHETDDEQHRHGKDAD